MDKEKLNVDLARKRLNKGLTQQQLADLSGLTIRTIQRIEKGEVTPYGDSIRKLAHALELSIDEFHPMTNAPNAHEGIQTRILSSFHFLALVGIIFPFTNILAPLFLWINYRETHALYDYHGRVSLNFQLTMTCILILSILLLVIYFPVGFVMFILSYLYTIIGSSINGIRAIKHLRPKYYIAIPFLKLPSTNL